MRLALLAMLALLNFQSFAGTVGLEEDGEQAETTTQKPTLRVVAPQASAEEESQAKKSWPQCSDSQSTEKAKVAGEMIEDVLGVPNAVNRLASRRPFHSNSGGFTLGYFVGGELSILLKGYEAYPLKGSVCQHDSQTLSIVLDASAHGYKRYKLLIKPGSDSRSVNIIPVTKNDFIKTSEVYTAQ